MEIWNRFTFRKDMHPLITQYMLNSDIPYKHGEIMSVVEICEDDPRWEEISRLLKLDHKTFLSELRFSKEDLLSAEWLEVRSQWYYDYPQPEDRYREITYAQELLCFTDDCGIEPIQKDSFRFKRTPKWGRRNFCMTNWVYDEFFVSPKAKELLEASDLKDFSFLPVKNKSGKEILADVFQMQIPYVLPEGLDSTTGIEEIHDCPVCGRRKYRASTRELLVFKKEIFSNAPDFVKSAERFGGGFIASRLIFVNQKAYRFLVENKLDSSLVFEPIRLI